MDTMPTLNTFEAIRDKVVEVVKSALQSGEGEAYIVCNVYARFSVYIVNREEATEAIRNSLESYIDQVVAIEKDGYIYEDLNRKDLKEPYKIQDDPGIYYIDRSSRLTNWNTTERYSHRHKAPIACFWSFKGGLGRTSALVLAAVHLARKGKKVVLMDFDLEAPGLASIFAYQNDGFERVKGITDYLTDLLATSYNVPLTLSDYYFTINQQEIIGSKGGEIIVFPAGRIEGEENLYLTKLSKITAPFISNQRFAIDELFNQINGELAPDHILVDTRTGLNDLGGLFLFRYADVAFAFFFGNKQNMYGLETLLTEFKAHPKLVFYLINSPVPKAPLAEEQRNYYLEKSYDLFSDIYYTEDETPFIEDETARHFPIEIPYNDLAVLLNSTAKLKSLADELNGDNPYLRIASLITPATQASDVHQEEISELESSSSTHVLEAFRDIVPTSAAAEYEFDTLEKLTHNFFPRKDYKFIFDRTKYLILGEKGAGKTALYAALNNAEYAKALARYCDVSPEELGITEWVKGMDNNYPTKAVFDQLEGVEDKDRRVFWKRFLLKSLNNETVSDADWGNFVAQRELELEIDVKISNFNQQLQRTNKIINVVYDYLDVSISENNNLRGKLVSALLEVWREIYARYPNIRAKIFLRKDIYEGEVNYVTDKVKFHNHLSEISWEYDQLLNIIWKRLKYRVGIENGLPPNRWIIDIPTEDLGPILGELPSANEQQNRAILTQLLGEYMGGNNKAFPYNWILYHVSDTKRRIQPRSLLNLFSEAARQQLGDQEESNHDGTLFTPKYMELANQVVSRRRVEDIKEEYPTLSPVFSSLSSYLTQFPVAESQLDDALAKLRIANMEIQDIKKKLEDIGVLYEYKFNRKGVERRYHIPDLYLIGMGLKRKGPGAHKALFGKK